MKKNNVIYRTFHDLKTIAFYALWKSSEQISSLSNERQ